MAPRRPDTSAGGPRTSSGSLVKGIRHPVRARTWHVARGEGCCRPVERAQLTGRRRCGGRSCALQRGDAPPHRHPAAYASTAGSAVRGRCSRTSSTRFGLSDSQPDPFHGGGGGPEYWPSGRHLSRQSAQPGPAVVPRLSGATRGGQGGVPRASVTRLQHRCVGLRSVSLVGGRVPAAPSSVRSLRRKAFCERTITHRCPAAR